MPSQYNKVVDRDERTSIDIIIDLSSCIAFATVYIWCDLHYLACACRTDAILLTSSKAHIPSLELSIDRVQARPKFEYNAGGRFIYTARMQADTESA